MLQTSALPADAADAAEPLLQVNHLAKSFPIRQGLVVQRTVGEVRAVDGVSFAIRRGETFGLMGESGAGKTTIGRLLLGLIKPTAGEVLYQGHNLAALDDTHLRPFRRDMQIIFQDSTSSLNPRKTIGNTIAFPIRRFGLAGSESAISERVQELLAKVGLNPQHANRYPHEFSGGQRQRIGIARALAAGPMFIVLDEPVSALDVSIQAQVLNLLQDLQEEFGLTYLFIANNLNTVQYMCDRVGVLYQGRLVELTDSTTLYERPRHPLTQNLISSILTLDRRGGRPVGEIETRRPDIGTKTTGCPYAHRCPKADDHCRQVDPELRLVAEGHLAACHYAE